MIERWTVHEMIGRIILGFVICHLGVAQSLSLKRLLSQHCRSDTYLGSSRFVARMGKLV